MEHGTFRNVSEGLRKFMKIQETSIRNKKSGKRFKRVQKVPSRFKNLLFKIVQEGEGQNIK